MNMKLAETFKSFSDDMKLFEDVGGILNEVLITFGGQKETRFGQIIIMAGGPASGKSTVLNDLIDVQGKIFNVDDLKMFMLASKKVREKIKDKTFADGKYADMDLDNMSITNRKDVTKLHGLVKELKMGNKIQRAFTSGILVNSKGGSAGIEDRKPNIIFDVTLREFDKLKAINEFADASGYDKKNIHIVWVLTKLKSAQVGNKIRDRTIEGKIVDDTHRNVSRTMDLIVSQAKDIKSYVNGYIILVFNLFGGGDVIEVKNDKVINIFGNESQPAYIADAEYVVLKEKGKSIKPANKIGARVMDKIKQYAPKFYRDPKTRKKTKINW